MGEHHLFDFIGHNPTAIRNVASLWREDKNVTLASLYNLYVQNYREDNKVDAVVEQTFRPGLRKEPYNT